MAQNAGQSSNEDEEKSLKNIFNEGMKIFETIENDNQPVNSAPVQMSIKSAMRKFESATNLVSLTGMFSKNESIEEVPTECLQYLLLPALLGTLSLKLCNQPRKEVIEVAEIYFRDFLQRCKDYGAMDGEIPAYANESDNSAVIRNQTEQSKIASMVLTRDAKIKRYKEMKELQAKLSKLKKAMDSPNIDDQTKREYFVTLLTNYVNQSLDELSSMDQEKPILEYMAKHAGENKPSGSENRKRSSPLKPVIITKDEIQKAIYGLGYPAIPTLTIEEFYDNRVREGIFPGACSTNIPHSTIQNVENDPGEDEEIRKERLIEEEDPEELQRQRNMDEFKDEHRRGEGNRHNRS